MWERIAGNPVVSGGCPRGVPPSTAQSLGLCAATPDQKNVRRPPFLRARMWTMLHLGDPCPGFMAEPGLVLQKSTSAAN
jgi:hypothetical protein